MPLSELFEGQQLHRVLNGSNFATAVAKSGGDSPATETAEDEYDDMMPQDKPEVTLRRQRKKKDTRERPSLPVNEVSF